MLPASLWGKAALFALRGTALRGLTHPAPVRTEFASHDLRRPPLQATGFASLREMARGGLSARDPGAPAGLAPVLYPRSVLCVLHCAAMLSCVSYKHCIQTEELLLVR